MILPEIAGITLRSPSSADSSVPLLWLRLNVTLPEVTGKLSGEFGDDWNPLGVFYSEVLVPRACLRTSFNSANNISYR
jgi:hypothetical protein